MNTPHYLYKLAQSGIDGKDWYKDAHTEIIAAAAILNVTPEYLAALLALFSPRCSVVRSVRHAIRYIRKGEFNPDVMRSIRSSVFHYEATGRIRGNKTEPFSRAILGDDEAIVLDVWMARAMNIEQKHFAAKRTYNEASETVRKVAQKVELSPAETQATIWTAITREYGRNPTKLEILRELTQGE